MAKPAAVKKRTVASTAATLAASQAAPNAVFDAVEKSASASDGTPFIFVFFVHKC
jgi:hypothetical protein